MGLLFKSKADKRMSMPAPPSTMSQTDETDSTEASPEVQHLTSAAEMSVNTRDILETPAFRIKKIKEIIKFYIMYFKRYVKSEKIYIRSMKKTNDMPDPLNQPVGKKQTKAFSAEKRNVDDMFLSCNDHGISSLLREIKSSQQRNLDYHQLFTDRISSMILPNLKGLKEQVDKYISGYYKTMEKIYVDLKNQNKTVEKKLGKLEKTIQEQHIRTNYTDPMASKIDLEKHISQEKEIEVRFRKAIDEELEKIKRWEVDVVRRIKGIIKEYYTFKIEELGSEREIFAQTVTGLDSFDYETEWNKFETKVRGDLARHTSINQNHHKKVAKIEANNKDIMEYLAEGPIKMKSGLIKTFKEYYAVLTSGLFLNIYKTQSSFQNKELPVQSLLVSALDLIHKDEKGVYTIYNKDSKIFSNSKTKTVLSDTSDVPTLHSDIGLIEKDKLDENSKLSWYVILYESMVKGREGGVGRSTLRSSGSKRTSNVRSSAEGEAEVGEGPVEIISEPGPSEISAEESDAHGSNNGKERMVDSTPNTTEVVNEGATNETEEMATNEHHKEHKETHGGKHNKEPSAMEPQVGKTTEVTKSDDNLAVENQVEMPSNFEKSDLSDSNVKKSSSKKKKKKGSKKGKVVV